MPLDLTSEFSNSEYDHNEVLRLKQNASFNLRQLREEIGVNQDTFAKVMGISRAALSYYENGSRTPDIDFINTVSIKTQCSLNYLLGWCPTMNDDYLDFRYALDLDENEASRLVDLCQYQSFRSIFTSDEFQEVVYLLKYGAHDVINRHVDEELIIWKCMKSIEGALRNMLEHEINYLMSFPEISAVSEATRADSEKWYTDLMSHIKEMQDKADKEDELRSIEADKLISNNPFASFRKRMADASRRVERSNSSKED